MITPHTVGDIKVGLFLFDFQSVEVYSGTKDSNNTGISQLTTN